MWVVFGILNLQLTGGSLKKLILRFSAYQRASEVMLERKPCKSTWSWVETRTRNKRVVFSDVFVYQISTYVLSTLSKTSQNASETKIWLWQNEELVSQSPFFGVGQVMLVSGRVIQGFDPPGPTPHGQLWWIGFRETNSTPKITYKFWSAIGQPVFHGK